LPQRWPRTGSLHSHGTIPGMPTVSAYLNSYNRRSLMESSNLATGTTCMNLGPRLSEEEPIARHTEIGSKGSFLYRKKFGCSPDRDSIHNGNGCPIICISQKFCQRMLKTAFIRYQCRHFASGLQRSDSAVSVPRGSSRERCGHLDFDTWARIWRSGDYFLRDLRRHSCSCPVLGHVWVS